MSSDLNIKDEIKKLNDVGITFINSKLFEYAIPCFDKILEKNPNNHVALYNKGIALDELGELEAANRYYTLALENTDYKDIDAWEQKGVTHGKLGELDEAIECFNEIIKIEPNNYAAWYNKGYTYELLHDEKISKKCCRKADKLKKLHDKSEKKTKVKTLFGYIEKNEENLKAAFHEVSLTEDRRIKDAQRKLHSRLNHTQRKDAYEWSSYYQNLIDGEDV